MKSEFNFFGQTEDGKQLIATYTLKSIIEFIKENNYLISGDPLINWNGGFTYILVNGGQ